MSIRCALGWHKWKLQFRHGPMRREEVLIPVIPSLFSGPPYLRRTGIFYNTDLIDDGYRCARCGKDRP